MIKPGQVIQKKIISDQEYIFRYPQEDDVGLLCAYINELSQERTFIRFQGEEVTLEAEEKYVTANLRKMAEREKVVILVFADDILVGSAEVTMKEKTEKHRGLIGVTIKKDYRDRGLGSELLQLVVVQAKQELPNLEILELRVYANNDRAIHLYKKLGFKGFGRLPRGIKRDDGYVDRIYMFKNVK